MECSEEFYNAIVDSGTLVSTCDWCGTTHFVDSGDFDPDELEELRAIASMYPEKYQENHDDVSIRTGNFNGKSVVYGCCDDKLLKYEEFIWTHRYIIQKYITSRCDRELKFAQNQAAKLIF